MQPTINALIGTLKGMGVRVYDTIVPEKPSYPYVLIEAPAVPAAKPLTLGAGQTTRARLVVTVAGLQVSHVRSLLAETHDAIMAFTTDQIAEVQHLEAYSLPVSMDTDRARIVLFAVEQYRLIGFKENN